MNPMTDKGTGLSRAARIGTAVALTAALSLGSFAPAAMAAVPSAVAMTAQSTPRTSESQPAILGTAYYGLTLDADPGKWSEPVTLQWMRDGKPIPSEEFYAYRVSKDDLGKALTLKVTGDNSGKVRVSSATPKVTYTPITNSAKPVITGNPILGSVLTASKGSWSQGGVKLSYQWLSNGKAISGATKNTYMVGPNFKGAKISVKVTAEKNEFVSDSAVSDQTAAVVLPDMKTATPAITGNTAIGQTLTAVPGSWTDGASLSYLWKREGIKIGTEPTYTLTDEDKGFSLTVTVTGKKASYNPGSETSARTAEIGAAVVANTAKPTISGTTIQGRTLTAAAGAWSPSAAKLAYQWQRGGAPIEGATGATYKLTEADTGTAITVKVTGTMDGYKGGVGVSEATAKILQPMVTGATPVVTGTPEVSRTLTAAPGTWQKDANLSYQWLADGKVIPGADALTYQVAKSVVGKKITFRMVGAMDKHRSRTMVSAATATITDLIVVNPVKPTQAGTAMKESTLRVANAGTWGPGTVDLSYQWLRSGNPVTGATEAKYTLVQADVGHKMSVRVTGSKAGYAPASVVTAGSAAVQELTVGGSKPTITGEPTAGHVLTANPGGWTKDAKLTYEWQRNRVPIPGANKSTYKLTVDDVAAEIVVKVTGTKQRYVPKERTSVPAPKILRGWIEKTKMPWIHGGHADGYTMTAKDVAFNVGGADISYQWLRNGAPIAGANSTLYVLTTADVGTVVSLRIKATKPNYRPLTVTTGGTNPVANAPILNLTKPSITGRGVAGSVMSTTTGTWSHKGLKFTYQWYANGKKIDGATRPAYRPSPEKTGTVLTVTVRAAKSKHTTGTATSNPTAAIK